MLFFFRFTLTVRDNLENEDSSSVMVTVTQDSNMSPVARAGADFSLTLPASVAVLNGSASWDDLGVARWRWVRLPESLAAGAVVGETDRRPVLMLVDLVPGRYTWALHVREQRNFMGKRFIQFILTFLATQVWDDQGKTSSDEVSFTVRDDPHKINVVRAVFNEPLASLSKNQVNLN